MQTTPPVIQQDGALNRTVKAGETVNLATRATDPDGNKLAYRWWHYTTADTYSGSARIEDADKQDASLFVPANATAGQSIHIICEVTDSGTPPLTRYKRVILRIDR